MAKIEKKIAVVLFNLGGPDSREAIAPFLYNFFCDRRIIPLPFPLRQLLAKIISRKRSKGESAKSYAELGYRSPLLENTMEQVQALEKALENTDMNISFKTFVCMRYWHPRAGEVIKEVKEYNPDHIVLLPLYPQFSTTTTGSSFNEWDSEAKRFDLSAPDTRICCYPQNTGFIKASVKLIKKEYEDAVSKNEKKPRLLLSAHGLPEYVIKGGDPYEWQCEQTAKAIIDGLAIEGLDWMQCFQSRVGPMKWTGPSTEEEIIRTAKEGLPIIIYAHAFVSEHVETLVELDIEYKMMALDNGAPYYARVPAVGVEEEFIQGLANIVLEKAGIKGENNVDRVEPCPETFGKCYLKNKENKR